MTAPAEPVTITPVTGLPEITAGADLAALIAGAAGDLRDGDILVITSKIVSKAEGRVVAAVREQAIEAETVRVVARRGATTIAQTRHGLVLAAAGVDESNTAPGTVVLLPEDPDESARRLRKALHDRTRRRLGVIVTDTMGRPWRAGQTDNAIGAAGVGPVRDHRGEPDTFGNILEVTVAAVADEIASAADLVKGKARGVPVALVRGLADLVTDPDGPAVQRLADPARGLVRVLGQQHDGSRGGVGLVHAGRGQDQPVPGLRDRGGAAPGHHPDRLRLDGLLAGGGDHPALGLAHDLGRDHEDVAVAQVRGRLGDQRRQVRARGDLRQPRDRDDGHRIGGTHLSSRARSRAARAIAVVAGRSCISSGSARTTIPVSAGSSATALSWSSTSQPSISPAP